MLPGRILMMSEMALRLASQTPFSSTIERSRWLYDFGRLPVLPWKEVYVDVNNVLNIARELSFDIQTSKIWIGATRKTIIPPRLKVYISPYPDYFSECLSAILETLPNSDVIAFKFAVHPQMIVRSDKLIVYFDDNDSRESWVKLLGKKIEGITPQGVPFTEDLGFDGLVSQAIDPIIDDDFLSISWRSQIADISGQALETGDLKDVYHSLEMLGVNTQKWCLHNSSGLNP